MAESIKFGPGWLRRNQMASSIEESRLPVLSVLGGSSTYRYGREEIIAVFSRDLEPPELFYKKLFVEKLQPPVALNPEEEESVSVFFFLY